jgi:hypothetical protein
MPVPPKRPVTHAHVRRMALAFPGVEEEPSYGTPAFKVRGKLLARFHQDGESLVLRMDVDTRDFVLKHRPAMFFLTDHYRNYPYVLVRLTSADAAELRVHFEQAWRTSAPKKLVKEHEQRTGE